MDEGGGMELVANGINKCFFVNILPPEGTKVNSVVAAIAYGSHKNEQLIHQCVDRGYKLDIWMRYDEKVPVTPQLLEYILSKFEKNIFCYLIRDHLHSKIVWWKGYGAYIGSANLTDRAWTRNIETGLFLTHEEIEANQLTESLEGFFLGLKGYSKPLRQHIIDEMKELAEQRKPYLEELLKKSKNDLRLPPIPSPIDVTKQDPKDKKKNNFDDEWHETYTILDEIAKQIEDYRPEWLKGNFHPNWPANQPLPPVWQTDQFLHAYYHNEVGESQSQVEIFHNRHKDDPQAALMGAMKWWKKLPEPPSYEDRNLAVNAIYIREHLVKDKVLGLGAKEIETIIRHTHSTSDYVGTHLRRSVMNRSGKVSEADRFQWFAEHLLKNNIQQLWHDVLYGTEGELWERLFEVIEGNRKIKYYGKNSWREIVGWACPEDVPPCNGRTESALRALGYSVEVEE